jgi:hypothetical protein
MLSRSFVRSSRQTGKTSDPSNRIRLFVSNGHDRTSRIATRSWSRPGQGRYDGRSRTKRSSDFIALLEPLDRLKIVWGKLKSHHLAHENFLDAHGLDGAIHQAVTALNAESTYNPLASPQVSA